jgi:hypothetical protein
MCTASELLYQPAVLNKREGKAMSGRLGTNLLVNVCKKSKNLRDQGSSFYDGFLLLKYHLGLISAIISTSQ